jgi:histone acetyltransferase
MAHVKTYLQAIGICNILTYADNTAIGYFQRQGFTKEINFDPLIWKRCIKDYQGATLIHCLIREDVDYLKINEVIDQQKRLISSAMPDVPTVTLTSWPADVIAGIKVTGTPTMDVQEQMRFILGKIQRHSKAWPFAQPVSKNDAAGYYDMIKNPMDLHTMEKKLRNGKYATMDMFVEDMLLIFDNCREYNSKDSVYWRSAKELEDYFNEIRLEQRLRKTH